MSVLHGPAASRNWCPEPTYHEFVVSRFAVRSDIVHLLGYARVSALEQNPDLQVDELTAAGCWRV